MTRVAMIALVAAAALAATGCGGSSTKTPATSQQRLTDLHTISQLQTAFQTASDQPRLIVLLSPT
jgi:ABC-type glycerol-3-phosphate transport system substrate-binding protein